MQAVRWTSSARCEPTFHPLMKRFTARPGNFAAFQVRQRSNPAPMSMSAIAFGVQYDPNSIKFTEL